MNVDLADDGRLKALGLPIELIDNVVAHNENGARWLRNLPDAIARAKSLWGLRSIESFEDLSFNYVARARRADGTPAVMKLCPDPALVRAETAWLDHHGGEGVARLYAFEPALDGYLMEALEPGLPVTSLGDDAAATRVIGGLIDRLSRSRTDAPFPKVAEWFSALDEYRARFGQGGPVDACLIDAARSVSEDLDRSTADRCLLHGDFHHTNVLSAKREPWLAIDPQGVIGDTIYETAAMLRNGIDDIVDTQGLNARLESRVAILSEILAADARRLCGWGFAQTTLSLVWTALSTDKAGQPKILEVARRLHGMFER